MPKGSTCAEIGVHKGDFSKRILKIVNPKVLHLIDPWKYETGESYKFACYGGIASSQEAMDDKFRRVKKRFKTEINKGTICIHRNFSITAAKDFPDEYFDWVYIDANHLYEFVKKVKKGGFLAGDDYRKHAWWKGGVKKAVDEFLEKESVKKILIKNSQFIIKKI